MQNCTKMKVNRQIAARSTNETSNGTGTMKKVKTPKQKKKKRLIIRNLSFKVEEDDLREIFSKFGVLKDVKIPLKEDGKKRGFGFVEFEDTKSLIQAMKSMNFKEIKGRKVAVDFAIDKNTYQSKMQAIKKEGNDSETIQIKSESEIKKEEESDEDEDNCEVKEDEDEKKLNDFLREFDSGADKLTKRNGEMEQDTTSEESSSDESEDESTDEEDDSASPKKKIKQEHADSSITKKQKQESHDISEGRTVFLRNVPFSTCEDSLREAMEEYGECEYCLLCMDKYTDHPKGTAFVKFKEKDCADKLVKDSFGDSGVLIDGRKLLCSYAISRDDVSHIGEDTKKPKDKRNLYLLRVGMIMANSKESEGVSPSDMAKRTQLEILKKQKLRNVNFFVSDRRLMIHNLPRTYTDINLRKLFKKAAGSRAHITECRVMKEFKKVDTDGNPLSKGYGFVSFSKHEDALQALNELNNNPSIFNSLKRPIVEFSVENKVALLSRERKKEKIKMRNKRRTEEKNERKEEQDTVDNRKTSAQTKGKKQKLKNKNNLKGINNTKDDLNEKDVLKESPVTQKQKGKKRKRTNKKNTKEINNTEDNLSKRIVTEESPVIKKKKKRKPKKSQKEKKLDNNKSQQENMANLVNKFKDKLKNKIT